MKASSKRSLLAGAAALLSVAAPAFAHDLWVQPSTFTPDRDELVQAQLFVGHHGDLEALPRIAARMARFEALGADGSARAILGREGKPPAGLWRPATDGVHTLVYQSHASYLELAAEKFEAYLEEEGLETALAERARRGESAQVGRESFSRCCKALAQVGASASGFDRVVGLPNELTALTNPFEWKPGEALLIELRTDGEPAADRQVEFQHLNDPDRYFILRTDAEGRVRFPAPQSGPWRVGSVHMRRSGEMDGAREQGEWESYWATLTFELGG